MRWGAEPGALEDLARHLRVGAVRLECLPSFAGAARGWDGADAEAFRARLRGRVELPAVRVAAELRRLARRLVDAAREQRRASQVVPAAVTERSSRRDGGRLVQRVGPVDAPVVVLLVPGVGSDRADGPRLARDAVGVWAALAPASPGGLAVVSWLGYDPPDTVPGAIDPRPASEGARLLAVEVVARRAAGAARVVVVGHSYGALVAGRLAAAPVVPAERPDVVVLAGAPGEGPPGGLGPVPASMVVVTAREASDPIALAAAVGRPLHGPDPVGRLPRLPTSGRGHGAYLSDPVLLAALADLVGSVPEPVPFRR
ncbi:MAG: alpha/beta hydrolase [Microthrixaceae bacterium]